MKAIALVPLIISIYSSLLGAERNWAGAVDNDFNNNLNWDTQPADDTTSDSGYFELDPGATTIDITSNRSIGKLVFDGSDAVTTLTLEGATKTLSIGEVTNYFLPDSTQLYDESPLFFTRMDNATININTKIKLYGSIEDQHKVRVAKSGNVVINFNGNITLDNSATRIKKNHFYSGWTTQTMNFNEVITTSENLYIGTEGSHYYNKSNNGTITATKVVLVGKGYHYMTVSDAFGNTSLIDLNQKTENSYLYNTVSGITQSNDMQWDNTGADDNKVLTVGGTHTSGTSYFSGDITFGSSSITATYGQGAYLAAATGGTVEFSGSITSRRTDYTTNGLINKLYISAGGTVILSGDNDFYDTKGGITNVYLNSGTLQTKHQNALGGENVNLEISSALDINDAADDIVNLSVYEGKFKSNGTYVWDIDDFDGTTAGSHWDLLQFTNLLDIQSDSSNKFNIVITRPNSGSDNFNNTTEYTYKVVEFGTINNFNSAYFNLDSSSMVLGDGYIWSIYEDGSALYLKYHYVPEPSTWVMISLLIAFCVYKSKFNKS